MDKNEKILFVNSAEKYIEDHKIYDLLENLMKISFNFSKLFFIEYPKLNKVFKNK